MNEIKFNEVTTDILKVIELLEYEDKDKELMKYELLIAIARFTSDIETYEENKRVLNELIVNRKINIKRMEYND